LSLLGHLTSPVPSQLRPPPPGNEQITIQRPLHFPTLDPITRATVFCDTTPNRSTPAVAPARFKARTTTATLEASLTPYVAPLNNSEQDTSLTLITQRLDQFQLALEQLQTVQAETRQLRAEQQAHQQQTRKEMAEFKQQFKEYQRITASLMRSFDTFHVSAPINEDETEET
jgi:septal ring factor EnvC (AmiA/AmiB activator)